MQITRSHPFQTRGISDKNAGSRKRFTVPDLALDASRAGDTAHEPMRKTRAQLGCKQRLASTGAHNNVLPRKGGQMVDWRPSLALLLLSGLPMLLIAASSWRGAQAGHSRWLPGQLNG